MKINDGTRGLSQGDADALEALGIFLEDYSVADVDVEPMDRGVKIRAKKLNGELVFSSFGLSIREAIDHMVRAAVR